MAQDIYADISQISNFNATHDTNGSLGISNFGTGQAFIDVNKDGNQDIVVSNQLGPNRLFINQGNETFIELSQYQDIAVANGLCKGVSVADFDNDGWDDIYFSCMGADFLFKNNNGQSFTDVTNVAGINNPYNTQSSAWADVNDDGWLDLYVINYDTGTEVPNAVASDPALDAFYLNNKDGTFTNIITELETTQVLKPNLAVTFFDYDGDGDQDLYVVSDKLKGNVLWKNDGPASVDCGSVWCFRDVSNATNTNSLVFGMGVAVGDIDNDGDYDLYFSSISEQKLLLNQLSQGLASYTDVSMGSALNITAVGWGTLFFDYNNDAWIDAYIATQNTTFELSDSLFENNHDGSFTNITTNCGVTNILKSEGVAQGDFNNDGKIDVILANRDINYQLFKNNSLNSNHWIKFKLTGGYDLNINAIGVKVTVNTDDGVSQIRTVNSGSSRGAGNELTLHFGLGTAEIISVKIAWKKDSVETINSVIKDQINELKYTNYLELFNDSFE